jgi:hypothetical protein
MPDHHAVVERVHRLRPKSLEEQPHVTDSTPGKPDGGDEGKKYGDSNTKY